MSLDYKVSVGGTFIADPESDLGKEPVKVVTKQELRVGEDLVVKIPKWASPWNLGVIRSVNTLVRNRFEVTTNPYHHDHPNHECVLSPSEVLWKFEVEKKKKRKTQ